MKTFRLGFGITLSIFLCAAIARADLKWEQTILELHPGFGDKQAVAHFKYQNVGKTPIHFKSVHASCGCTAAQSQKEEVPAGEKGEVTATFNIGDRTGTQVKTVTVQTDDPDPTHSTTILTLKAVLPEMLTINPAFVFWKGGEEPTPKTITVKAGKDFWINAKAWGSAKRLLTAKEIGILDVAASVPERIPSEKQSLRALESLRKLHAKGFQSGLDLS